MNSSEHIAFIIQARLGSTRLPNKIIRPFWNEQSIIDILIERLKKFSGCPSILATSTQPVNELLVEIAKKHSINFFVGSENDVLNRFIDAADAFNIQKIIRVCSDNPFLNTNALQLLLTTARDSNADYIGFQVNDTPSIKTHFGFWAEFVTTNALKMVNSATLEPIYREHVTNFIYSHPEQFKIQWLPTPLCLQGRHDIRLTIDTLADYQNTQTIYKNIYASIDNPRIEDIVDYIDSNPQYLSVMKQEILHNSK